MKSFVVTIEELLKVKSDEPDKFCDDISTLCIPKYQREYKWEDEKIITFINDIKRSQKFLGNIILDQVTDKYEIVDGQQRITTCVLIVMALFNRYNGHEREQRVLRSLLKDLTRNVFYLENNSIGEYILETDGIMQVNINPDDDIYSQQSDFLRAFNTIKDTLNSLENPTDLRDFRDKFLESEILVLVNTEHRRNKPVEQIFLDINEKAQLLEPEDIFKGHCFEIYDSEYHNDLRDDWVKLKKHATYFKKFGISSASEYIYLFLIESENADVSIKLRIENKHYLEDKTSDQVELLLKNMISFGNAVQTFSENVSKIDYDFTDICSDSNNYTGTNQIKLSKYMCKTILTYDVKATYHKLPLMYFIYFIKQNRRHIDLLSFENFKRIICNLYIYSILFSMSSEKKSKKSIDHTVEQSLFLPLQIASVQDAVKNLRKEMVDKFEIKSSYNDKLICFIYSIIDNFVSNSNWITNLYADDSDFNLEHFIIPQKKSDKIKWVDGNRTINIDISNDIRSNYKKKLVNFLYIDKSLNGDILKDYDIVTKIQKIREWYPSKGKAVPNHVMLFIERIESMPEYTLLRNLKTTEYTDDVVSTAYGDFLHKYFLDDEFSAGTLAKIERKFKDSFRN